MNAIGPATDVYAMGAILYEMLTGRPPHFGESATEIYGKIMSDDPVAPSRINAGAPRDLETIALKALDKEPSRRYPTAGAMAEDLGRYLAGEPILAHRFVGHPPLAALDGQAAGGPVDGRAGRGGPSRSDRGADVDLSRARQALSLWTELSASFRRRSSWRAWGTWRLPGAAGPRDRICRDHLGRSESAHARYFLGRLLRARGGTPKRRRS